MFEFMSMGNYTVYVWSAVGVVSVSLFFMAYHAHIALKRLRKAILWSHHASES